MDNIKVLRTVRREYVIDKRKVSSKKEILKIIKDAFDNQKEIIESIRIYADSVYDRVIVEGTEQEVESK